MFVGVTRAKQQIKRKHFTSIVHTIEKEEALHETSQLWTFHSNFGQEIMAKGIGKRLKTKNQMTKQSQMRRQSTP